MSQLQLFMYKNQYLFDFFYTFYEILNDLRIHFLQKYPTSDIKSLGIVIEKLQTYTFSYENLTLQEEKQKRREIMNALKMWSKDYVTFLENILLVEQKKKRIKVFSFHCKRLEEIYHTLFLVIPETDMKFVDLKRKYLKNMLNCLRIILKENKNFLNKNQEINSHKIKTNMILHYSYLEKMSLFISA